MIHAAGVLLRAPSGRVLLLQRSSEGDAIGLWALPGGKIEEGENAAGAAFRETYEETGYRIGAPDMPLMHRVKDGVDFITFLKECDEEFVPKLNSEHTAWGWFSPAEFGEPIPETNPAAIANQIEAADAVKITKEEKDKAYDLGFDDGLSNKRTDPYKSNTVLEQWYIKGLKYGRESRERNGPR